MELRSFITLDAAIKRGLRFGPRYGVIKVPVLDAVGRYCAVDVVSRSSYPSFDRSAVDGYAVNSSDTISSSKGNPSVLTLVGELFPSQKKGVSVSMGEAAKIMTGSRIPKGADSVVMLEDAEEKGRKVRVSAPVRKFQNVSRKGEDIRKGMQILRRGEVIDPPHVAALMECGINAIDVFSLKIGIVSTGDELVSGLVANSTQPMLHSLFQRKGFETTGYGAVGDSIAEIENSLSRAKDDLLIVTGGTGPGDTDLLPRVIEKNGRLVFRGLRIRPGRTTSFGVFREKPIFMVSGLPVAGLIAAENVILRLIHEWLGLEEEEKEYGSGILGRSVVNTLGFRSFVRVKVQKEGERTMVHPTRVTGSGVIYSVIDADGILVVDENSEGIEAGERVVYEVLRW